METVQVESAGAGGGSSRKTFVIGEAKEVRTGEEADVVRTARTTDNDRHAEILSIDHHHTSNSAVSALIENDTRFGLIRDQHGVKAGRRSTTCNGREWMAGNADRLSRGNQNIRTYQADERERFPIELAYMAARQRHNLTSGTTMV